MYALRFGDLKSLDTRGTVESRKHARAGFNDGEWPANEDAFALAIEGTRSEAGSSRVRDRRVGGEADNTPTAEGLKKSTPSELPTAGGQEKVTDVVRTKRGRGMRPRDESGLRGMERGGSLWM